MGRAEERGQLGYIGIRHEGAASFAASGYAKLSGRPAACLAIAGPGSTNLLTGLYDAKVDGAAVIAISGHTPPSVASIDAAAALLREARRPVIVAGDGARAGLAELLSLAERMSIPIPTTFRAKGLVPDDHPLAAGILGRSGTPVASWLMNEWDLVLVVGASFSNHTGIATYKTLVSHRPRPGNHRAVQRGQRVGAGRCATRADDPGHGHRAWPKGPRPAP